MQQTALKFQYTKDVLTERDEKYNTNGSLECTEERELSKATQHIPPHDCILSQVVTEVDGHDVSRSDLAHDDVSTCENDSEVDVELGLGYEIPYSGSTFSASQSDLKDSQGSCESEDEVLLDSEAFVDRALHWMSVYDGHGQPDDLRFDAMHEEYMEDANIFPMEEPVLSAQHNFENGLPYNRDNSMSGTRFYSENDELLHHHGACLGAESVWHHHLAYSEHSHEFDDTENLEAESNGREYWAHPNSLRIFGDTGSRHGLELPLSGHGDDFMNLQDDAESLECTMGQRSGSLEERYQDEDMFIHPNDTFTNEGAASMSTGEGETDVTESTFD